MKRYLKFWGTRGSCPVSGPEYLEFGGNTCCLEVCYDDLFFIIDAGTGIRPLGEVIKKRKTIDLFLSHTHLDHVVGLPFFQPIYVPGVTINIWAPENKKMSCAEVMKELLGEQLFPVYLDELQAKLEFRTIQEKQPVKLGPITLDFFHTLHPGITYCFKIQTPHETITYTTDNEVRYIEKEFIEFHKNCDLFIHEAQYTSQEYSHKKGWGHSSLAQAISLVEKVAPKQWLVTHHDPKHTDTDLKALAILAKEELKKQNINTTVEWIKENQTIALK